MSLTREVIAIQGRNTVDDLCASSRQGTAAAKATTLEVLSHLVPMQTPKFGSLLQITLCFQYSKELPDLPGARMSCDFCQARTVIKISSARTYTKCIVCSSERIELFTVDCEYVYVLPTARAWSVQKEPPHVKQFHVPRRLGVT